MVLRLEGGYKMANLILIDSGFPNTTRAGTKTTTANLVNSGVRVPLSATIAKWRRGLSSDDSPYPASYGLSTANPSSVDNPQLTIKGIINKKNNTFDRDDNGASHNHTLILPLLDAMCSGTSAPNVKCLWYGKTTSGESYTESTDSYVGLFKSLGTANATDAHSGREVPSSTPHLHVIVTGFDSDEEDNKGLIRYTLQLQVTN